MAGMKFDASDRTSQIMAPTLVVTGSEDRVVPSENSKRLSEKIPNSRFVEIQGTGHLAFIEQAEEFNKMVLGFLKEVTKDKEAVITMKEIRRWWRTIVSLFYSY
jgi:pimeloyl-ACP methyl ester carboxylesterase